MQSVLVLFEYRILDVSDAEWPFRPPPRLDDLAPLSIEAAAVERCNCKHPPENALGSPGAWGEITVDSVTIRDVVNLLAEVDGPVLSAYIPMQPPGRDTRQNALQLRAVLTRAEEQWHACGFEPKRIKELLKTAKDLLEDDLFWQDQGATLCLFTSMRGLRRWRLRAEIPPQFYTDHCFHVRPLMPCLDDDRVFFLLAVSQNEVRFWRGKGHAMEQIPVPAVDKGLAKTLHFDRPEPASQAHSSQPGVKGKEGAAFHGQGGAADARKDEILQFFRDVDRAVAAHLHSQTAPLYFAGVSYLFPIYQKANRYRNLVDRPIEGNPELLSADDLRAMIAADMRNQSKPSRASLDRFFEQAGSGKTSVNLAEIALAAARGQVDTLFVVADAHRWGRVDPSNGHVEFLADQTRDACDVYEHAVGNILTHHGQVFVLDPPEMPDNELIGAIYRYPLPAGNAP